jgi:oligoribonuclease NrnB/cAMP/cGMP phosphodiesterase (DHH superfamily)
MEESSVRLPMQQQPKIVVTHADSDGVLCLATFMKAMGECRAYFSSPSTLLHALRKIRAKNLYIFDISGTQKSVFEASKSEKVLWIDHHVWGEIVKPKNIEFYLDSTKSACRLVSRYFGHTGFEDIADEIDTNSVISEEADKLRKIVAYYKGRKRALGLRLFQLSKALAERGLDAIEDYKREITEYEKKIEFFEALVMRKVRVREVKGLKVAVLQTEGVPVYIACNKLIEHPEAPFDIILVYSKTSGRIELRTHTGFEVLRLAKIFGGGGHKVASGAKASIEDMLTAISLIRT